ncbi:hypothetical protein QAD02_022837 [Eretmocerus hayati]|uniref:Uncharacterized protein n=1 Tax=Eretmocerus hayati TaxID=131215 RepID=A0ACC2PVR5_9HYME|nr:hypothetical protein QAD02_022837 [Eretmocerus hayati]
MRKYLVVFAISFTNCILLYQAQHLNPPTLFSLHSNGRDRIASKVDNPVLPFKHLSQDDAPSSKSYPTNQNAIEKQPISSLSTSNSKSEAKKVEITESTVASEETEDETPTSPQPNVGYSYLNLGRLCSSASRFGSGRCRPNAGSQRNSGGYPSFSNFFSNWGR